MKQGIKVEIVQNFMVCLLLAQYLWCLDLFFFVIAKLMIQTLCVENPLEPIDIYPFWNKSKYTIQQNFQIYISGHFRLIFLGLTPTKEKNLMTKKLLVF